MNSILTNVTALACLGILCSTLLFADGVKTINGGDWADVNNWTPAQLPDHTDSVIVNGTVTYQGSVWVRSLVVNGSLTIGHESNQRHAWVQHLYVNNYMYVDTLEVSLDILNSGQIAAHNIITSGNVKIVNSGLITEKIYLQGYLEIFNNSPGIINTHIIKMNPNPYSTTIPLLKLVGEFKINDLNLNGNVLDARNAKITQGNIENTIVQGGYFSGSIGFFQGVILQDSVTLFKPGIVSNIVSYGTVVLMDSMLGVFSLSSNVSFHSHGTFINKGVVGGRKVLGSGNRTFTVNVDSTLYLYGAWVPDITNFTNSYKQSLWLYEKASIGNVINTSSGELDIPLKLRIAGTANFGSTKIYLHGDTIFTDGTGSINGGEFLGNATLHGCTINASIFKNGNIAISKKSTINGAKFFSAFFNTDSVVGASGIQVFGNIMNYGYWNTGSITVMDSIKIIAASGSIFQGALSTASPGLLTEHGFSMEGVFDFDAVTLYSWRLYLKGGKLRNAHIEGANIYNGTMENCTITRNGSYGATSFFHDTTVFQGTTIIYYDIAVHGNLIVKDSLKNDGLFGLNGNTHVLTIYGTVENQGIMYNVHLRTYGDMINKGTWTNFATDLRGGQPRSLWLAPGKIFRGDFAQTLAGDSVKTISILTDVTFGGTVNLAAGAKWIVSGQTLSTTGNAVFHGGLISGNVILKKFNALDPTFKDGNVTVSEACSLNNASFYAPVTNNDSVQANNIYLYNNLQNNKCWNVNATSVKESLSISAAPGSTFGSNLTVQKDGLRLSGEFDFQYYDFSGYRVYANNALIKNALQVNSARMYGGIIEGSLIRAASELYDSVTFRGTTKVRSSLKVAGWLLNKDSLIADPSEGTVSVTINGNVINEGTIHSIPMSVSGNITNQGGWNTPSMIFTGSQPRTIQLGSGKSFHGTFSRQTSDSSFTITALSDLRFTPGSSVDLGTGKLVMNGKSVTVSTTITARIIGPVHFKGNTSSYGGFTVVDSAIIDDTLNLPSGTEFFGPVINHGLMAGNSGVSYYGDIVNNGKWDIGANYWYVNKAQKRTLRLKNSGSTPVSVAASTITGSQPSSFLIAEGSEASVIPQGQFKQIAVRYVDTTQISAQAKLNIPSSGIGTLSTIYLVGDTSGSALVPLVSFDRSSILFGQVKLDSLYTQRLLIRNPRVNQLSIDTAFTKGGIFTVSVPKRILENNDSALVAVSLVPTTFGLYDDTLIVMTNAFPFTHKFPLSAFAPQPDLSTSAGFFQFPQTALGDSTQMFVKLRNHSLNVLTIDSIRQPKQVFHLSLLPSSIGPNDSITVVLRFSPTGFGVQQDSLKVYSNGGIAVIRFSGESPFPSVTVSSLIHSFGQVKLKDTSTAILKLKNASINSATIQSIVFHQQMYTLTDTPKTIGRNDSVQVTVRFVPTEFKTYNDTLSIVTNGGNFFVLVNGASPKPNLISVAPQISFGTVIVDSTRTLTFRMTNTSLNSAVIDSARTGSKQFKISRITFGTMINNRDTITVAVSFTPDTSGSFNDTAMFFTNSVTPVVLVSLIGNGSRPTWVDQMRNSIPEEFNLFQNFPNPFNPSTTIRYGLPSSNRVSLKIYNVLGQQIADLVNIEQSAGWYETVWTANVSSGLYFYRIEAESTTDPNQRFTQLKKMILLK